MKKMSLSLTLGNFYFFIFCLTFLYLSSKHRDNVEWDQELLNQAQEKIKSNSSILMSLDKASKSIKNMNLLNYLLKIKESLKIKLVTIGINFIQFMKINFSKTEIGYLQNFQSF